MGVSSGVVACIAALAGAGEPATVVRAGDDVFVATTPDELTVANGEDAFTALDRAERDGFWAGYLSYELGRSIERVNVTRGLDDDVCIPDLVLGRHDARIVCRPGWPPRVVGDGPARPVLERAVARALAGETTELPPPLVAGRWRSSLDRREHAARVAAIHELLSAGACYQVNLTRQLAVEQSLDPHALASAIFTRHEAPHAALFTFDGPAAGLPAVVSASPELFLRCTGRAVETRPIKGTAAEAAWLRASGKDRAENVMIVDLARNDLGRVCEPGTVGVPSLCEVETHPGLHHLVSTVTGTRRTGVTLGQLVRATFPPASITGAPKPRVMQVIEDLEPVARGVYCGAVGWIDAAAARSEWAVAIRTFTMVGERTTFGVGGGIVADSQPSAEWAETKLKAGRLLALTACDAAVGSTTVMAVAGRSS